MESEIIEAVDYCAEVLLKKFMREYKNVLVRINEAENYDKAIDEDFNFASFIYLVADRLIEITDPDIK